MIRQILLVAVLLFSMQVMAQTGIGTTTPHASAKLDVSATNKGFLPPRVTLTSNTDVATIPSPAEGLLVYNLGSSGLQAGYYYWNSANWATIATAALAGNAVVAVDLVKLYAEAWSNASNKIGNSNGYSFTVPVSGRYAFDFSSTTYGSTSFTINFYVRQGTTNLASDGQVSTNNGVRVEYNGKFEVNLQAGTTYNVYVTSTNPNRGSEDYDRVYYKMVAGNLPVNQHLASANIQLNNNYLSNDGGNEGIRVDNSGNVGIGTTTPIVPLEVNGAVNASTLSLSNSTNGTSSLVLKNGDAATAFTDAPQIRMGWSGSAAGKSQYAQIIHTRHNSGGTNNAIDFYLSDGTAENTITSGSTRAMSITSPGNVEITGKLSVGDPTGNVVTKASGLVNAGSFVTLDNVKATVTSSGNRSLSIGAVSTSFNANISGYYGAVGGGNGNAVNNQTYATSASTAIFGWNFPNHSESATYLLQDSSNSRMYRITMMIGPSYINNFISIERLF